MKRFQVKINDVDVEGVLQFNSSNDLTIRGGTFNLKCLDRDGTFYDSIKAGNELVLLDNDFYLINDDFSSYNTTTWTDPQPAGTAIVNDALEMTSTNAVYVEVFSNETFFEQILKARVKFTDNLSNINITYFGFYNPTTDKYILIYATSTQIIAVINGDTFWAEIIGTADTDFHDIIIDWTDGNIDFYLDGIKTSATLLTPTDKMNAYLTSSSESGVTSISTVDNTIVSRKRVFGGYIEPIKRNVKFGRVIEINGGDYTLKLNKLMVDLKSFKNRELSVMVRELAFQDLIKPRDIDDCEATTGWNYPPSYDSFDVDSSSDANGNPHARVGTNCLKGVITDTYSGGSIYKTFASYNITDNYSLGMYFFIADASKLDYVTMYLGNSHTYSYYYTKVTADFSDGWNYLIFNIAEPTGENIAPYLANVTWIEFDIRTLSPYPQTTFRIDDLKFFQRKSNDFNLDNVQTTEVYLENGLFRNKSLFQCYQKICGIREDLYDFYIDVNKSVNFGVFGTSSSGQTFSRGVNILSTSFLDDPKNLYNDVTLFGGRQQYTFFEEFNGTGSKDAFTLQYEPLTAEVTVGGVIQKGYAPDSGETFDYKIDQEARQIIFESGSIPAGGTNNVDVTYTYSIPTVVRKKNSESISLYGIRRTKIDNELITNVNDGKEVVSSLLDRNSSTLAVGKINAIINTNVDVGETIKLNDLNLFDTEQTFTATVVKHFFIGRKPHTEITVTDDVQSIEDFLADIFRRLNVLEDKEKGIIEITINFVDYNEDQALTDSGANLSGKTRNAAGFVIGHPTLGQIGDAINPNTNSYGSDIITGKSG